MDVINASAVPLLSLIPLDPEHRVTVARHFEIVDGHTPALRDAALAANASRIRCVLTIGSTGLDAATIARLPALELVSVLGAGYENVDVAAARDRGIAITTGAGTNEDCVADHALALLLAIVREIPMLDRATRDGVWRDALPYQRNVSGKRLGVLGLGRIGRKIARRAAAFDCAIGYHNRRPLDGFDGHWFDTPTALAAWCDYLVVAAPGGPETKHLVDAAVLAALGPSGYLVNIARGSIVDTAALAAALDAGTIAGAGLDVYEGEPVPPAALIASSRVVLTPHVGGRSPEAVGASYALFVDNATRHFAGEPLLTPL
jgi:lactate dehydrogenase-like 2-hydroxyacid dehydrogenase